jgi:hypothetical protein
MTSKSPTTGDRLNLGTGPRKAASRAKRFGLGSDPKTGIGLDRTRLRAKGNQAPHARNCSLSQVSGFLGAILGADAAEIAAVSGRPSHSEEKLEPTQLNRDLTGGCYFRRYLMNGPAPKVRVGTRQRKLTGRSGAGAPFMSQEKMLI